MKFKRNQYNNQVPKGSYHAFCRQYYGINNTNQDTKNSLPQKIRYRPHTKSVNSQKSSKIEQFDKFQQYLQHISSENKKLTQIKLQKISQTVQPQFQHQKIKNKNRRQVFTAALKQRHSFNQENTINDNKSGRKIKTDRQYSHRKNQTASQIVGAFLPFFKTKLEISTVREPTIKFKISNNKFKLKARLIEENKPGYERWAAPL